MANSVIKGNTFANVKQVASGSMKDIAASGIYYVNNAVTDKPTNSGGLYIVSAASNGFRIGLFVLAANPANGFYIYKTFLDDNGNWSYRSLHEQIKIKSMTIEIPANDNKIYSTASVDTGYTFLGWTFCASIGWVGHVYPSSNAQSATFFTSEGSSTTARQFTAYYLEIEN